MVTAGLLMLAGLGLLAYAPDRFVEGSAGLADRWGLPRVVIGAVVIGFGTSTPELLVSGLAAALTVIVRRAAIDEATGTTDDTELGADVDALLADERTETTLRLAGTAAAGLLATLAGAHLLVTGALDIADRAGLTGGFVGMTVVAIGTSLPELVTAASAARAGEGELIIGNVVGSNILNALAVGATVALIGSGPRHDATLTTTAVSVMLLLTVAAAGVMARDEPSQAARPSPCW